MKISQKPAHLEPSPLGTKEHWEETYNSELENHALDPADEGTIWFEENNVEEVILEHLEDLEWSFDGGNGASERAAKAHVSVVDVGTGNGHFLFAMQDAGWQGDLVGLDYSAASVELARNIHTARHRQASAQGGHAQKSSTEVKEEEIVAQNVPIRFEVFDVLNDSLGFLSHPGFDLAIDKGTFDAISLSPQLVDEQGCRGCELYAERVASLIRPGGWLVVTSCNWTVSELRAWIETPGLLEYGETIEFPVFEFGGVKGQTVSSVCFRRMSQT